MRYTNPCVKKQPWGQALLKQQLKVNQRVEMAAYGNIFVVIVLVKSFTKVTYTTAQAKTQVCSAVACNVKAVKAVYTIGCAQHPIITKVVVQKANTHYRMFIKGMPVALARNGF